MSKKKPGYAFLSKQNGKNMKQANTHRKGSANTVHHRSMTR